MNLKARFRATRLPLAMVALFTLGACSDLLVAPSENAQDTEASYARKPAGPAEKNKSCEQEANPRAKAPKDKNQCEEGPTEYVATFNLRATGMEANDYINVCYPRSATSFSGNKDVCQTNDADFKGQYLAGDFAAAAEGVIPFPVFAPTTTLVWLATPYMDGTPGAPYSDGTLGAFSSEDDVGCSTYLNEARGQCSLADGESGELTYDFTREDNEGPIAIRVELVGGAGEGADFAFTGDLGNFNIVVEGTAAQTTFAPAPYNDYYYVYPGAVTSTNYMWTLTEMLCTYVDGSTARFFPVNGRLGVFVPFNRDDWTGTCTFTFERGAEITSG